MMKEETTESMINDIKMVAENTSDSIGDRCFSRVSQGKSGRACRRDESLEDWQVPTRGYGTILTLSQTGRKREQKVFKVSTR